MYAPCCDFRGARKGSDLLDMDMDVLFTLFHVLTIGNYIFVCGQG